MGRGSRVMLWDEVAINIISQGGIDANGAYCRKACRWKKGEKCACPQHVQSDWEFGQASLRTSARRGVFFETDVDYTLGSEITFAIELDGPAEQTLLLRCRGMIVRVEHRSGKYGVGVKIVASQARVSMGEEPQLIQ